MKNIAVLLLVFSAFTTNSCWDVFGKRVSGNGTVITQDRTVGQFKNVDVRGSIDVIVKQDSVSTVKIQADQNLMEYIEVIDDGNVLIVRERRGFRLRPTKDIKVFVTAPLFKEIRVSGAGDITSDGKINSQEGLTMSVSGAGDVTMDVNAPNVQASLSGSGTINLKGQSKDFEADISGAGDANCFDMLAENTSIEISGAGSADVYASVKLDVRVSGAGSVTYKGSPTVNQRISGAGSVNKAE
jgi:putative autotransporter adhesin-like protein